MKKILWVFPLALGIIAGCSNVPTKKELEACGSLTGLGLRKIADNRAERFQGKVEEQTAYCRGGDKAVQFTPYPWVDWANYWATGDASSRKNGDNSQGKHLTANGRGIDGTLIDLEYQRMELIKFNLLDNNDTYQDYVQGKDGTAGPVLKVWEAMRLPADHPEFHAVGGDSQQLCQGDLIRFRNLTGICNDIKNPLMGSTHMPFARNVQFEATYPDLGKEELARNRHGDRLGLLKPDPQVISRVLFTRQQTQPEKCQSGYGAADFSPDSTCDYQQAPFFNVLAAYWIQFMTHDWFSHLIEGHNQDQTQSTGCQTRRVGNIDKPLTPEEIQQLGCRPGDTIDKGYVDKSNDPVKFNRNGKQYLSRAYRTTDNNVTAWWDASQLYGYDETSRKRVKRNPKDPAKLLLIPAGKRSGEGEKLGYLPKFTQSDPIIPQWAGQESTAFPDNWTVGLSFYHNLFAREHNQFVTAFRAQTKLTPDKDSGLRNPAKPDAVIRYKDVSANELFEVARLVIAAEIAKIHTTEWTPQLLYNEPLYLGMNANWHGLFQSQPLVANALRKVIQDKLENSKDPKHANQIYSVLASGPGIFGMGSRVYKDDAIFDHYDPAKTDVWSLKNPDHINGGVNHFGSPFNFPEEFVTVYRLHPLLPDLIEYRDWGDPNTVKNNIPVVATLRGQATEAMEQRGLASWGLSLGRQRLGLLTLQNQPQFLQNLIMPRLNSSTGKIDVAALDLIRDRERGIPRFNEFRRQYGLRQLTSFDDFIDPHLAQDSPERDRQRQLTAQLREIYGQHSCDQTKIITSAQLNQDGSPINDCLGHPNGSMVDNIEDVDTVVGWLAEFSRPHGYAISETQFQVFILNASRRLFSDRFFTSSFRPEFYTNLGVEWVVNNGPDGKIMEQGKPNGHEIEVSPLKRVLLRNLPELKPELDTVVNAFDPWARDRGEYYSLQWKPRPGAETDPSFEKSQ